MDVPKAMSILGFSAARIFESTTLPEIEKKFTSRIHALETYKKPIDAGNDKRGTSWMSPLKVSSCTPDGATCIQSHVPCITKPGEEKTEEMMRANEAYQFLQRKLQNKSGRSMATNWQQEAI